MATPPFLPDESKPGDSDIVSQFPAVERLFRDIIESWLLIDHDTDGEHIQVTLPELGADPTNATNTGFLYTKDDSGDTELFYEDDDGNVIQMTADGGAGPGLASFPANTSMLFYQSAAPTGWTKDTAALLDKHGIEVVTTTAWATGSNGATAFDSVFGASKVTGSHVLLTAETPKHRHFQFANTDVTSSATHNLNTTLQVSAEAAQGTLFEEYALQRTATAATVGRGEEIGGDGGHTHTLSLDLNFLMVIRATKD